MKYKFLLAGKDDSLISEIFGLKDNTIECITSSVRNVDIIRHIKYFKPNALIFCLQKELGDTQKRLFDVKDECALKNIPVVIVGNSGECDEFKRNTPSMATYTLLKPVSASSIIRSIIDYLGKKNNGINNSTGAFGDDFMRGGLLQELPALGSIDANGVDLNLDTMLNNLSMSDEIDMKDIDLSMFKEDEKRKHILVVDDDKGVLKMLKTVLSDDYDVATALNGKVAMKFLETKSTDLILLDYEMPGERGPEVFKKIKANEKISHIPVVFLTGVTETGKIKDVLAMKPQGYLLKPINMERLNNTIKDLIG